MRVINILLLFCCIYQFAIPDHAAARPKYLFKIASLAPEGSVWVTQFQKFTSEVSEKTGGEVGFRIYPGGVMGDDQAVYRKMRVGQLHGGGFTMTGISFVVPDFRVMSIPFLFKSYQEVDAVAVGLLPVFQEQFRKKGLEMIAMTEVGFLYAMSTKPISTIDDLKNSLSWIPAGDPVAAEFFKNIGATPVQLSIPDVLSSLQTGLVDTVYNALYGSIVLQWFTKARYVTDAPFGYAYGAFLLDNKKFSKLPPEYAEIIRSSAKKYFAELLAGTRESNLNSRQVLATRGVSFIPAKPDAIRELEKYRETTVTSLVGKDFSKNIYEQTISLLEAYRKNRPPEKSQ